MRKLFHGAGFSNFVVWIFLKYFSFASSPPHCCIRLSIRNSPINVGDICNFSRSKDQTESFQLRIQNIIFKFVLFSINRRLHCEVWISEFKQPLFTKAWTNCMKFWKIYVPHNIMIIL